MVVAAHVPPFCVVVSAHDSFWVVSMVVAAHVPPFCVVVSFGSVGICILIVGGRF